MTQDEASTLILVPTPMELAKIKSNALTLADQPEIVCELCGFGPIAAAARAMQAIFTYDPSQVILAGIAGSFDDNVPNGSACWFERVACDGVGAGSGSAHESAAALGWHQWMADGASSNAPCNQIGDTIDLVVPTDSETTVVGDLLTVCSASADSSDAAIRLQRHPTALAEDMEGFGVAMACRLAGVPLHITRGISNRVGDRDKANWDIDGALRAAAHALEQTLLHVDTKHREH